MTYLQLDELLDSVEAEMLVAFNYQESERICLEVLAVLEESQYKSGFETLRARALVLMSITLWRQDRTDEALPYAESALTEAKLSDSKAIKAKAYGMLGTIQSKNPLLGLECLNNALALYEELGDKGGMGRTLSNLGSLYCNVIADYAKGIEFFSRALPILEEVGDKESIAVTMEKIARVYFTMGTYEKTLEYYKEVLRILEEIGVPNVRILNVIYEIGFAYYYLGDYDNAMEIYGKVLIGYTDLKNIPAIAETLGNIGQVYKETGSHELALEYYGRALASHKETGDILNLGYITGCIGDLYRERNFSGYDADKAEEYLLKSIAILNKNTWKVWIIERYKSIADLYEQEERWKEYAYYYKKYRDLKDEIQSEEIRKQTQKHEMDRTLAGERAHASATNEILSNILPPNITERLLKGEKRIADTHENVSVLFADIVGFTQLSSQLPAGELIDILDIVFTRFDTICKKHGLEKIKTIGDAYMAVCGAPVAVENHAEHAAFAALEMLENFSMEQKFSVPINLGFRIGLHSGSVVAGIIGENKYSYDLWGDAVNTASRMESHGEEDKIHVSEEFRNALISTSLNELPIYFIPRGEVSIKGKGIMKTYFIETKP
ncbi:MAG: tetratricopeptide repeat protein [Bacteroidetes bacterium]|nr:tetratricopeptide repeat protein [Bacteroidota bacterium]